MIQVSYIRSANKAMSTDELLMLLQECREHNAKLGITGMLPYGNATFVQVVEGEDKPINDLLAKIRRDPRHSNVQLLSRKQIDRREYADWSMAFKGRRLFGGVDRRRDLHQYHDVSPG